MDKSYELSDEKVDELVNSWLAPWAGSLPTAQQVARGLVRGAEQETRKNLLRYLQGECEHRDIFATLRLVPTRRRKECLDCWPALLRDHEIEL